MGYGGLLSGLVQGYAGGVQKKKDKEYEAEKQKRQDELRMYQVILDSQDADPQTKAAAFGKIEEVLSGTGNGKKAAKPGILSQIGGLLTGHNGQSNAKQAWDEKPPTGSGDGGGQKPSNGSNAQPTQKSDNGLATVPQKNPQAPQQPAGMQPPPAGFKPHFYSPEEKQQQKQAELEAEQNIRMKYFRQQEQVRKEVDIEIDKARAANRQYTSPVGPKPGGNPWEFGKQVVQDGQITFVPTTPPKDVEDAHQMAESLARTNGKSVLENYDLIWTMKAQGMKDDEIAKQLRNVKTQADTNRTNQIFTTDEKGNRVFVTRPGAQAPTAPPAGPGMAPPPGYTPPNSQTASQPPAAPQVIQTGIKAPPKVGKGSGKGTPGGITPQVRKSLDQIEKDKNKLLDDAHKRAVKKAEAPALTDEQRKAIWANEAQEKAQIQREYEARWRTEMTGRPDAPGGGKTVKMKAPDGSTRDVAADQVDYFKSLGAKVVQ